MGGGASNSHKTGECSSNDDVNAQSRHKIDANQIEFQQGSNDHHEIPNRGLRTLAPSGNNRDEECSYSPEPSRDQVEDDFDCHPSHDEDEEADDEEGEDDEEARQLRMLFAQSAMSMDMDNEDLIFNLLYFGGDTSNFASMMNSAAEETVAAHSAGNTPYKLTPATEGALNRLKVMIVTEKLIKDLHLQECSICQEELEVGSAIAEMPGCSHCFHNECVLKWFALQSWCPVCRTKILPGEDCCGEEEGQAEGGHCASSAKGSPSEGAVDVKSNLGGLFSEVADDRMEEAC